MLLFGLLLSAALGVQPSTSPSTMPSTSPSTGPSTSPSTMPSTSPSTSPSIAPTSTSTSIAPTSTSSYCAELDALYPECDDEYQGATPCDPPQEDSDFYEEHCEDAGDTYTVESRLTMSGVTSSNFESKKSALKTVISGFFNVTENKVSLAFDANDRRMLEESEFVYGRRTLSTGEIVVTIATTDSTEAYAVRDTMETPTFTTDLTSDITSQSSTFTELAGVSVTSATAPSVSAPTTTTTTATTTTTITTTTTSMEGSGTALMSFVAIVASALLF